MMDKLVCKICDANDDVIYDLENLRCEVFGIDSSSYYFDSIKNGKILCVACFFDNQLVGGLYASDSFHTLLIDQIFVKKEFQNNSLHVGSYIIKYVFENKQIFDKYFNECFDVCRLESRDKDSFYSNLGFKKGNDVFGAMRRRM